MTRINVIPVQSLCDQHLLAEYREITRIDKTARLPKPKERFPTEYILGAGHVKFFYNKGLYLQLRTQSLFDECKKRGFNVQFKQYQTVKHLKNDYHPDDKAIKANLARLNLRLVEMKTKPRWTRRK